MKTEELEELLSKVTQGEWRVEYSGGTTNLIMGDDCTMCDETYYPSVPENLNDWELISLAPSLARRVIADEKLVEAGVRMRDYFTKCGNDDVYATADFNSALTEYEATR